MLLTSGQISMGISSCICKFPAVQCSCFCSDSLYEVFIFTTLLFLSGYVLQQQTVRSIQEAIRPPPSPHPPPINNSDRSRVIAKHFGSPRGHSFYDRFLVSNRPKGGWAKAAYVQLVRKHVHICNAVMLFAELERQESMAQRIMLYPKEWHFKQPSRGHPDLHVETSLRLLRNAAKRYKVELQPVSRIQESSEGVSAWRDMSDLPWTDAGEIDEAAYPLVGLLSLTIFSRLVYIKPSGLILDSAKLDLLFTLPMGSPVLGISGSSHEDALPSILLLEPSMKIYHDALSSMSAGTFTDDDFLQQIPLAPGAGDQPRVVAKTSAIHLENDTFNATDFLESISYVQITDRGIPGPEFNAARQQVSRAKPKKPQQRKAWETVYEMFRQRRMEICGLDLQPLLPMPSEKTVVKGHDEWDEHDRDQTPLIP